MPIFKRKEKREAPSANEKKIALIQSLEEAIECGYVPLTEEPTIVTACEKVAALISMVSWHLMSNTASGDVRIENELSRKIDIDPNEYLTRAKFYSFVIMTLLLYGDGNAICRVHTRNGYIENIEPIAASRVSFLDTTDGGYEVLIDGIANDPRDLLHFTINADKYKPWKGHGLKVTAKSIAQNLTQGAATERAFMKSKWKPSVVVKVDALTEEFSSPEGRKKLLKDYVESSEAGEPWMIPAEQFQVESFKPLTLQDLAINDSMKLNKTAAAAIVGVPAFMVGVGNFNQAEYNNFVNSTVKTIVTGIAQELTKKLILNPKWYLRGNVWALMDWDVSTVATVFNSLADRGFVTGNEVRDHVNLPPKEGLDELRILENYIPTDMSGLQKKLIQGD